MTDKHVNNPHYGFIHALTLPGILPEFNGTPTVEQFLFFHQWGSNASFRKRKDVIDWICKNGKCFIDSSYNELRRKAIELCGCAQPF